jgi:hypothetical protein
MPHTANPSYRTPWDDWDEELFLPSPGEPLIAICYWADWASPNLSVFRLDSIRDPEDVDLYFTLPNESLPNESLLLIW